MGNSTTKNKLITIYEKTSDLNYLPQPYTTPNILVRILANCSTINLHTIPKRQ